jgi:predicted nucleic acid-binding protein
VSGAVLDASVLIGLVLQDEPWHAHSRALASDLAEGTLSGIVGSTFPYEVRNVLVKAARRGRISWSDVAASIATIDHLALAVSETRLADTDLLATCRRYGLAWGDAQLVLLAAQQRVPLITADLRLVAALRDAPVWVESIADRPLDPA